MEHVRQTGPECYLCAVSMVTGRPIETIRREADTIAKLLGVKRGGYLYLVRGRGYADKVRRMRLWRQLERILAKRYGIPPSPILALSNLIPSYRCQPEALDLTGRGMFFLLSRRGGHAVAYENGAIFDSNEDGPLPASDWLTKHKTSTYNRLRGLVVRPYVPTGTFFE